MAELDPSPSPANTTPLGRRPDLGIALLLFVLAGLLFAPSVATGTFLLDDITQVLHNRAVREGDVHAALTRGYWANTTEEGRVADERGDLWRPLTTLSVLTSFALYGETAWPYHLENVLLHALCAALVFAWLRAVGAARRIATTAGLLFAVAPIHVEAVCGIILRNELLAMVFGLLALLLLARGRSRAAALGFFLALGAKESAIALPLAAILVDRVFGLVPAGSGLRPWLRRYAPSLLAVLLYLGLRFALLGRIGLSEAHGVQYFHAQSWPVVWLTMARFAFEQYLVPALLGAPLVFDFSYETFPTAELSDLWAWTLLALEVLGVLAAFGIAWRARSPIAAGIALAALLLAPTSNAVIKIGVIGANRLFYAPYLGIALALATVVGHAARRLEFRRPWSLVAACAGLAVLAGYGIQTVRGQFVWRSEESFWRDVLDKAPARSEGEGRNALAWANLCSLELRAIAGRPLPVAELHATLAVAQGYGERALTIDPAGMWVHVAEALIQTHFELGSLDGFLERIDLVLRAKREGSALPAEIRQIEELRLILEPIATAGRGVANLTRLARPTKEQLGAVLAALRSALATFPARLPPAPTGFELVFPPPKAQFPPVLAARLKAIRQTLARQHEIVAQRWAAS